MERHAVRRNARGPERPPRPRGGGRLALRAALGLSLILAAAWFATLGPAQAAVARAPQAQARPTSTFCPPIPATCAPSPSGSPSAPPSTPPPTATPVPTPTPPPPSNPTTPPTPYSESGIAPGAAAQGLPSGHPGIAITPVPNGSGSTLPNLAIAAMALLATIAGACIFLFFRLR
jgi:hypothetical protein